MLVVSAENSMSFEYVTLKNVSVCGDKVLHQLNYQTV